VTGQSSDDIHQAEVWTTIAPGYDAAIAPVMRPFAASLLDLLGLTAGTGSPMLLDVAAGTGAVALEAARRGADVLATDFAAGMVEVMRRQLAAEGLPGRAQVMDGQHLLVDDDSVDLGTSTFGLMYFPDPVAGLRELHRVLRPAGRVGIATWDLTRTGLPQLIAAALTHVDADLAAPPAPSWAWLCSPAGLKQALRQSGFTDIAVHEVTHHAALPDPADFFRQLPNWTPPLRPLFANLPPQSIDRAGEAFADVVRTHSTPEGLPQTALIGVARRAP